MTLASMLLLISLSTTAALRPAPHVRMSAPAISVAAALRPAPHVRMAAPEAVAAATTPLTADRYVATNRFRVRSGKANRLEERWRNRKSRLSFLPGFRVGPSSGLTIPVGLDHRGIARIGDEGIADGISERGYTAEI